jgi:hypothetical protein
MLQALLPHPSAQAKSLAEQLSSFTFEGAPAPGTFGIDAPSVIGHEDWHTLFNAALAQLRRAVAVRPDGDIDPQVRDAGRTRTRVLECVSALEKLQAAHVDCDDDPFDAARSPLRASNGSS